MIMYYFEYLRLRKHDSKTIVIKPCEKGFYFLSKWINPEEIYKKARIARVTKLSNFDIVKIINQW